ncbi:hypothetical protein AB4Z52_11990 [Rhizobium sp. 2YAF20]|uniref:hypothetical protein n=1 Tax=Rhizobium sp. 2YAF20 TaxID=3233027 RepID=UPI003F94368C
MKIISNMAVATALALLPGGAFALSLTDPIPPGHIVYPYKDLPGVTAPHPAVDDNFKCHTAIGHLREIDGIRFRSLPRLIYVCEQNGVISESTRPPNRPYWQYNDPER